MDLIKVEDIIDTKIVNNTTYKLIICRENGVKMKLWIPEYLVGMDSKMATWSKPILSVDEKVARLYQQLKMASSEELLDVQRQIVQLSLHELPSSSKAEIHSTIVRMIENYKTERRMCPALVKKLRRCILHEELAQRRRDQLSLLFCLEKEINLVSKSAKKIEVENFVDLEILPFNFSYLNANVPGVDVSFPKSPPIGCDCIGKRICLLNNCCPEMFNSQPTYNEFGEVLVSPQSPIYECNRNCKCVKICSNRIVQRGSNVKLSIFRTKTRGWGVRTMEPVKKGTFVIEYTGEVIKRETVAEKFVDENSRHYLFDLNFNFEEGSFGYTIDSSICGNISRFLNHSCDPNLNVYSVWINWSDPKIYHIALFASRDIENGEELTFDYAHLSSSENRTIMDCKCESIFCRKNQQATLKM